MQAKSKKANPKSGKPQAQAGSLLQEGMLIVCVLTTVRHPGPFFKALL